MVPFIVRIQIYAYVKHYRWLHINSIKVKTRILTPFSFVVVTMFGMLYSISTLKVLLYMFFILRTPYKKFENIERFLEAGTTIKLNRQNFEFELFLERNQYAQVCSCDCFYKCTLQNSGSKKHSEKKKTVLA